MTITKKLLTAELDNKLFLIECYKDEQKNYPNTFNYNNDKIKKELAQIKYIN